MRRCIYHDFDHSEPSPTAIDRGDLHLSDAAGRSPTPATIDARAHEPILKELGARIRLIRHELHLSQQECAELCHIDRAHISRLERGRPNTSVLHLAKLAHGLGVEIADLFKA